MTNIVWYEPVGLLETCTLNEALLWMWNERPVIDSSGRHPDGNVFAELDDWECDHIGIPPVPRQAYRAAHLWTEEWLQKELSDLKVRSVRHARPLPKHKIESLEYFINEQRADARIVREWLPSVIAAMELPASKLYVTLREGRLQATGKLLPKGSEIADFVTSSASYSGSEFDQIKHRQIPAEAWSQHKIDWIANALTFNERHYCEVTVNWKTYCICFHPPLFR